MRKILGVLAVSAIVAVTGCSTGSRTDAGPAAGPGATHATWVNEAGWVCDGNSCRVPRALQSRSNG